MQLGLVWYGYSGIFYFPKLISKFMDIKLYDQFISVYFPVILIAFCNFTFIFFLSENFNIYNFISFFIIETTMFLITFSLINTYHKNFDKKYFLKIF